MCEEACINCEQCEEFKNGCQGQTGTFCDELCPTTLIDGETMVS